MDIQRYISEYFEYFGRHLYPEERLVPECKTTLGKRLDLKPPILVTNAANDAANDAANEAANDTANDAVNVNS